MDFYTFPRDALKDENVDNKALIEDEVNLKYVSMTRFTKIPVGFCKTTISSRVRNKIMSSKRLMAIVSDRAWKFVRELRIF